MRLRRFGKILLVTAGALVGLVVVLLLAVKLALDRVPHYQVEIKDWVHAQIGYHIAFEHVSPAFRWYGPELYFDRLELRSKDDRRSLARAAGGRIGVDVWQLVRSGKLIAGRIELDAPQIVVTRLGPHQFALASEIMLGSRDSAQPLPRLDDLPAGTLAIRGGQITLERWNASLPLLEFHDVNLDLRRDNAALSLGAALRLPTVLGGELRIDALAGGIAGFDTVSWTVRAHARDLAFAGFSRFMPDYLSRLGAGTGGFTLSVRGHGADVIRADLDTDAANVAVQLTSEPGVTFEQIAGSVTMTHAADRWTLSGRRLRAVRAGRRDPESRFDLTWRATEAGLLEFSARANYLRTEALLPLAGLLPQKDLRERLQETEPTGEWFNMDLRLERATVDDPWRLNVGGTFRGLGFAPVGLAPGLRGLNGSVSGTQAGGHLELQSEAAVFAWPAQFTQPVELHAVATTLYWSRTPLELLVATPSIEFRNKDATVHGRLAWHRPADGSSPVLALALGVDDGNVAAAHLYLPRARLPAPALAWLNRALVAGHLSHADVAIAGPILHFPFRDGTGLFAARAQVSDLTLDYREGWPPGVGFGGVAEFRNEGMHAEFSRGSLGTLAVDKVDARFVDFKTAELQLTAASRADAADVLAYLRATPLDAMAEHLFSQTAAAGPLAAEVELDLPFREFDKRRIDVHTHLQGIALHRSGSSLVATELKGDVDFDGAQAVRADVHGRLLGGSFQMLARPPRNLPATRTHLTFNGSFSGDALRTALGLPASMAIDGTTDWHGELRVAGEPARERSLHLAASLEGLSLKLPEPLRKPEGQPLPAFLDELWPVNGPTQVRVGLGAILRGQATVNFGPDGPELARAAVIFGTAPVSAPAPVTSSEGQRLTVGGNIDRLDLGGWLKVYTPDQNSKPIGNFLHAAHVDVGEIDYLGLAFSQVAVDLTTGDAGLKIALGGPNVSGSILLPGGADAGQPWQLEFQRLKFADASPAPLGAPGADDTAAPTNGTAPAGDGAGRPAAVAADVANPRAVPALQFHAADVVWDERQFGDVKATLIKLDDGIRLEGLRITGTSYSVSADGEWRGKDAGIGRIEGTLSCTDAGATLKQLGYADVIEAKTGKMDFDLGWLGAPTAADVTEATGHVQVALDKGQITGLKPGAGRVMGLASLAALPRRLALDFSDLTDKGFAFDTVRGSFDLRAGSAFTDDLLVKGPAAEIGLIGRVGLKSRDYDQTVVVTGNVNSSLSLAAFAGGPVIGAAVLVFTQVFKQPLKGLARGYYRITGSWDNPTVERIKSADAAAAAAEAPK